MISFTKITKQTPPPGETGSGFKISAKVRVSRAEKRPTLMRGMSEWASFPQESSKGELGPTAGYRAETCLTCLRF